MYDLHCVEHPALSMLNERHMNQVTGAQVNTLQAKLGCQETRQLSKACGKAELQTCSYLSWVVACRVVVTALLCSIIQHAFWACVPEAHLLLLLLLPRQEAVCTGAVVPISQQTHITILSGPDAWCVGKG